MLAEGSEKSNGECASTATSFLASLLFMASKLELRRHIKTQSWLSNLVCCLILVLTICSTLFVDHSFLLDDIVSYGSSIATTLTVIA